MVKVGSTRKWLSAPVLSAAALRNEHPEVQIVCVNALPMLSKENIKMMKQAEYGPVRGLCDTSAVS
jgi:hypothetical protein